MVGVSKSDLVVVEVLPGVDLESGLVRLEGDSEADSGAEHHLRALHEVVHHVLQGGNERLLVDHVEVDQLVGCHLDSNISADEIDISSRVVEFMVLHPEPCLGVDFEEQD